MRMDESDRGARGMAKSPFSQKESVDLLTHIAASYGIGALGMRCRISDIILGRLAQVNFALADKRPTIH